LKFGWVSGNCGRANINRENLFTAKLHGGSVRESPFRALLRGDEAGKKGGLLTDIRGVKTAVAASNPVYSTLSER